MEHVQRRYNFQTEQIKRQHEHVMNAYAARVMRDRTIKTSYEAGHVTYDEYKAKMAKSRTEMFRQEKIACLDYIIAMKTFDREMYISQPETFVAPEE